MSTWRFQKRNDPHEPKGPDELDELDDVDEVDEPDDPDDVVPERYPEGGNGNVTGAGFARCR